MTEEKFDKLVKDLDTRPKCICGHTQGDHELVLFDKDHSEYGACSKCWCRKYIEYKD